MLTEKAILKLFEDLGLQTQDERSRFLVGSPIAPAPVSELIEHYETVATASADICLEPTECQQTGASS